MTKITYFSFITGLFTSKDILRSALILSALIVSCGTVNADGATRRVSLSGMWKFTADYHSEGDTAKWFSSKYSDVGWDLLSVPGTWSHDPRYMGFIGNGWFRKHFIGPELKEGQHVRLAFGAVFSRSRVWLNDQLLGEHEGGYTPFEFDVGSLLKPGKDNLIVVCADNRWDRTTIPGASWPPPVNEPWRSRVYPWWDDGGIIRDVALQVTPGVYLVRQKIEASPDLATGVASVKIKAFVRNTTSQARKIRITCRLTRESLELPIAAATADLEIGATTTANSALVFNLPKEMVKLWSLDAPTLYQSIIQIDDYGYEPVNFGIRRFEVRGEQFLLNGHQLRLAGANWHASHPDWGQNQPTEGVIHDLQLMKEAGLVFQRLTHYAVSPVMLDWADRHGMLLMAENGNTGSDSEMLASEIYKNKFRSVQREMIERDWNHPSIIAWSVGNEFDSHKPEGVSWVKEMSEYTRQLDNTRLISFPSNKAAYPGLKPEEEGSYYTDFICLNTYGNTYVDNANNIDRVHALYPGRPLIITEYGKRFDFCSDEMERVEWFKEMLAIFRERPFVSGASIWSFNDYRSRHVGTNPNGWREWGVVSADRTPRATYDVLRREHSGFIVKQASIEKGVVTIKLEQRMDFPMFPPSDCELRVNLLDSSDRLIETQRASIRPGVPMQFTAAPYSGAVAFRAEIWRADFHVASFGFVKPQQ